VSDSCKASGSLSRTGPVKPHWCSNDLDRSSVTLKRFEKHVIDDGTAEKYKIIGHQIARPEVVATKNHHQLSFYPPERLQISTGTMVGIQIKTGTSYTKQKNNELYFTVTLSADDAHYLNIHQLPVAVIFYEPETGISGWIDATGFLRDNIDTLKKHSVPLTIRAEETGFDQDFFEGSFKKVFLKYRSEVDRAYSVELMVSHDTDAKYLGFLRLMRNPGSRYTKTTCFILLNNLFCEDEELRCVFSDALSRYMHHPEISFPTPVDIRSYLSSAVSVFTKRDIIQLLETALFDEENLMQRGSIGQSVGVIIQAIPNHKQLLYEIAIDSKSSDNVRLAAMALAYEFSMCEVIQLIASDLGKLINDNLALEAITIAKEALDIEDATFLNDLEAAMINKKQNYHYYMMIASQSLSVMLTLYIL